MAAPSFIQEAETVWNTSTSPKTTASFSVLANDVLVAFAANEEALANTMSAPTGGSLTWTQRQSINVDNYCEAWLWTAVVDTNKSMTVTFTHSGPGVWGGNVLTFRASDGVGASTQTHIASGAPTLNITTTQANSALVVLNGDYGAVDGASRTWRTNAGTLSEVSYFRDAARYGVYGGYHADAGSIGTYAVGLSAPTGQKYSIVVVEVKGTAGAAATSLPFRRRAARMAHLLGR